MAEKQHVFLVGAKSLGAYGGYETFIDKLTEYHQDNKNIQYHVAVKANGQGHMDETKVDAKIISGSRFIYHNADCFKIHVPEKLGPAQAIYYDCKALDKCVEIIKEEGIKHPIVYIMACRIGPFMKKYYKAIHRLDGKVYLNPDGHEWMRAKWSDPVRKYWKVSEQMMVKYSDLAVCDSVNIEKYIHEQYDGKGIRGRNPKTTFIAYGAETRKSLLADDDKKLLSWYEQKGLKPKASCLVLVFIGTDSRKLKLGILLLGVLGGALILQSSVFDKYMQIDKIEGGGSITGRLAMYAYYFNGFMQHPIMGQGFIKPINSALTTLLYGPYGFYYLEDVGIVGCLFTFGLVGVFLFLTFITKGMKTIISGYKDRSIFSDSVVLGVFMFLVFTMPTLFLFDYARNGFLMFVLLFMTPKSERN